MRPIVGQHVPRGGVSFVRVGGTHQNQDIVLALSLEHEVRPTVPIILGPEQGNHLLVVVEFPHAIAPAGVPEVPALLNEPDFYVKLVGFRLPFEPIDSLFRHGGHSLTLGITLQQKVVGNLQTNAVKRCVWLKTANLYSLRKHPKPNSPSCASASKPKSSNLRPLRPWLTAPSGKA